MKLGQGKHFIYAFLISVVFYAVLYVGIERWRVRKGPWQVTFSRTSEGVPQLIIDHAKLGISQVHIVFPGAPRLATNLSETIVFDKASPVPREMPLGSCVFLDTTFLPGTVTLRIYGHEIELLPRVLVIDHTAKKWIPGSTLHVEGINPPALEGTRLVPTGK